MLVIAVGKRFIQSDWQAVVGFSSLNEGKPHRQKELDFRSTG